MSLFVSLSNTNLKFTLKQAHSNSQLNLHFPLKVFENQNPKVDQKI